MEREPIPQEEIKKLIIPKKGDIFKALGVEPEKEKPKRETITREDFILGILANVEYYQATITRLELNIGNLQSTLQKMYNCEALGYKLEFYKEDKFTGFNIKKKPKVGFRKDE